MKPRILLLMGEDEREVISKLNQEGSPYSFVNYKGPLTSESVKAYFEEHLGEFDAVAVFSIDDYSKVREAMENVFDGPKILLHTSPLGWRYDPPKGKYLMEVRLAITPSKFDKLVEKHFKNL